MSESRWGVPEGYVRQWPEPEIVGPSQEEQAEQRYALAVDLEEARDSEELHALYRDLEFVIESARYLANHLRQQENTQGQSVPVATAHYVLRSVWIAAIVTYIRCFTSGKRQKLDESIFTGEAEYLLAHHSYFRDTRNKHIAHSVNPFEVMATGVGVLNQHGENPRVDGVMIMHAPLTGNTVDDVESLVRLATYTQVIVLGRMEEANQKLLARAKEISKEELRKLERLTVYPEMGTEAAKTPRQ